MISHSWSVLEAGNLNLQEHPLERDIKLYPVNQDSRQYFLLEILLQCWAQEHLMLVKVWAAYAELVVITSGTGRTHPGCVRPGLMYPMLVNTTQA